MMLVRCFTDAQGLTDVDRKVERACNLSERDWSGSKAKKSFLEYANQNDIGLCVWQNPAADSSTTTASTPAPPLPPWPNTLGSSTPTGQQQQQQTASPSVVYAGQETQLPILPMEDDDLSDHESVRRFTLQQNQAEAKAFRLKNEKREGNL